MCVLGKPDLSLHRGCFSSVIVLEFAVNDIGFISFAVVYGLGTGAFMPTQFVLWMSSVVPEHRPSALATGEVIASIGVLTGSPFIGIKYILAYLNKLTELIEKAF